MSKHTPGPWSFKGIYALLRYGRKEDGPWWEHTSATDWMPTEAEAHLIAAAPDLLAASKLALETLTNNGFSGVSVNALTLAIVKAEGGDA